MDEATRKEADRRFEEAIEASGARDPRDFYRTALKELKEVNPEGYGKAVEHFQTVLVPGIASGDSEPLTAWRECGRFIAEMMGQGRTLAIDDTGLAKPYTPDCPLDQLVLHLPDSKAKRGITVSLPPKLSPAQKATFDLLVQGKHRLPA
jgi:hypothetical protein